MLLDYCHRIIHNSQSDQLQRDLSISFLFVSRNMLLFNRYWQIRVNFDYYSSNANQSCLSSGRRSTITENELLILFHTVKGPIRFDNYPSKSVIEHQCHKFAWLVFRSIKF